MTEGEFIARYSGIYEHSAWVAEEVAGDAITSESIEQLAAIMADCVDNASTQRQLTLIRAHPDLAGKAQLAGELTQDSSTEQSKAGLDQCSADEYAQFQTFNDKYHEKFGFPFIMAVRASTRAEILTAFAARLENDAATEFETALQEIHKIAMLRLQAMEADE
jgi:2-oxo-4-hydroxy-4-carboxy-5-ureidoimidazoline decarboxylase